MSSALRWLRWLTTFAVSTRFGADLLSTLTAIVQSVAGDRGCCRSHCCGFGLGNEAIVFVLIHSVLWSVSLNTLSGFLSVSPTPCGWRAIISA